MFFPLTSQTDRSALVLALAFDLMLGEPPTSCHPVVGIGRLISRLTEMAPRSGKSRQLVAGAIIAAAATTVAGSSALLLGYLLKSLPISLRVFLLGLLIKPAFAARDLYSHLERIRRPLERADSSRGDEREAALVEARSALQMIVSRDTKALPSELIAAAAIESAAENLSDSFVAPLLYFALFGPVGAWSYRAINTLDAMVGYHGEYEYIGKAAARLDDLANIVPGRLTALLIALASPLGGGSPTEAIRVAICQHGRTESPNAGWPMAAMAGSLRVTLEKVGHYRLGEPNPPPMPGQLRSAIRITLGSMGLMAALSLFGMSIFQQLRKGRTQ